jgi:hypothetical protein
MAKRLTMLGGTSQQDWYQDIVNAKSDSKFSASALPARATAVLLAAWAETLEAAEDD